MQRPQRLCALRAAEAATAAQWAGRRSRRCLALRLLSLLLLLLYQLGLSSGMGRGCDANLAAWRQPTVARPTPALYELDSMQYNATLCLLTFSQLQDALQNDVPCHHMMPVMLITCPQHCLRAIDTFPSPLVLGSFSYHNSSSVCLAAIHSGIITSEAGGGVFAERFYPLTWAGDSTQSIFPHGSHAASLSNGGRLRPCLMQRPALQRRSTATLGLCARAG
jgi:hypothetical protein